MIKYIAIAIWCLVGLSFAAGITEHAREAMRPPVAAPVPLAAIPKTSIDDRFPSVVTMHAPKEPISVKIVEYVPQPAQDCVPPSKPKQKLKAKPSRKNSDG